MCSIPNRVCMRTIRIIFNNYTRQYGVCSNCTVGDSTMHFTYTNYMFYYFINLSTLVL